jgi:hypothetical protein
MSRISTFHSFFGGAPSAKERGRVGLSRLALYSAERFIKELKQTAPSLTQSCFSMESKSANLRKHRVSD